MIVDVPPADRLVNKTRLARHLGVTVVTIGNWIERFPDLPVHSRGTNGREYEFDLAEVVEFLRARKEDEQRLEAERDATLSQLVLPLLGDRAPDIATRQGTGELSLKDQKDALLLSRERRREMERLGQLVEADKVQEALAEALATWNRALRVTVRAIGHDFNLPATLVRAIELKINDAQRAFVRDAAQYLEPQEQSEELRISAHG